MDEIVTWVKQWPDATVLPVDLLSFQAHGENKARRNRFYEQFGLVFDYRDPKQQEGLSRAMPASALTPVKAWKSNILERDIRNYLGEVLHDRDRMAMELASRERAVKNLADNIQRAEAKPIRWALRQTWWRLTPILTQIGLLLVVGGLVWSAIQGWS